jgi:hypothetical protein
MLMIPKRLTEDKIEITRCKALKGSAELCFVSNCLRCSKDTRASQGTGRMRLNRKCLIVTLSVAALVSVAAYYFFARFLRAQTLILPQTNL